MVDCEECEKKLGILEGYRHPALGARFVVCGKCFDKVAADMERWSTFYLSSSFTAKSSSAEIHEAWNSSISYDPPLQRWFYNLWNKLEVNRIMALD